MSPKKAQQVLAAIARRGGAGATVRQISDIMGIGDTGVRRYVAELRRAGKIVIAGEARGGVIPIYVLKDGALTTAEQDIFEQCRTNWSGYRIHKVFGAGGAVRL